MNIKQQILMNGKTRVAKAMMNGGANYTPISTDNGNSFKFWQRDHASGTGLIERAEKDI